MQLFDSVNHIAKVYAWLGSYALKTFARSMSDIQSMQ